MLSLYLNLKHPKSKKKLDVMRKCMEERMNNEYNLCNFLWLLKKKKKIFLRGKKKKPLSVGIDVNQK